MTFARILIPLSGTAEDASALAAGLAIARQLNAHAEASFIQGEIAGYLPVMDGISPAIVDNLYELAERDLTKRRALASRSFEAARATAGLPVMEVPAPGQASCRWTEMSGRDQSVLMSKGRLSDLIVFGRAEAQFSAETLALLEAMLFETARPLLLAPAGGHAGAPARIAIGWNDSPSAVRAVAAGLPLMKQAAVSVLSIGEEPAGQARAQGLADYLGWHGIEAQPVGVAATAANGQALLQAALAQQADLLVVGGYGHSRVREFVLGGVTRDVIDSSPIPILIVH